MAAPGVITGAAVGVIIDTAAGGSTAAAMDMAITAATEGAAIIDEN